MVYFLKNLIQKVKNPSKRIHTLSVFSIVVLFIAILTIVISPQKAQALGALRVARPPIWCVLGIICPPSCSQDSQCPNGQLCINGTCKKPPPACNAQCSQNADCNGGQNGCTVCMNGQCKNPSTCNASCSKDADCVGGPGNTCTTCVNGTCSKNPSACNASCTKDTDCIGGSGNTCSACIGGTCKTPSLCNASCSKDADCAGGAGNTCNSCIGGTCIRAPACNVSCTKNSDCNGAKDSCTACVGGTCKTPSCGTSCSQTADCAGAKDGCGTCIPAMGSCQNYSNDMCSCDGIDSTDIASGQQTIISAFAKVDAPNTNKAQVESITLFFTKNNDIISQKVITPTIVETTPQKVRFKATWNVMIPAQLDPNASYRLFVKDISCKPKSATTSAGVVREQTLAEGNTHQSVLAATTQTSFLDSLWNSITSFFGGSSQTPAGQTVQPPTPSETPAPSGQQSLHLSTFSPVDILEKSCKFILFKKK